MGDTRDHDFHLESLKKLSDFLPFEDWSSFSIDFAQIRLNQLEKTWTQLRTFFMSNISYDNEAYVEATRMYVDAKTILQQHMDKLGEADETTTDMDISEDERTTLNIIGMFDGNVTKWYSFHDRFVAGVHTNISMNKKRKLILLQAAVAPKILGRWSVRTRNYELAWQKLRDTYNGLVYETVRGHIDTMFTMAHMKPPPTFDAIYDVIDTVTDTRRQLMAMDVPADKWETMIVYVVEQRLDEDSRRAWDSYRDNHQIIVPKWIEMEMFLHRFASTLPSKVEPEAQLTDVVEKEKKVEMYVKPQRIDCVEIERKFKSVEDKKIVKKETKEEPKIDRRRTRGTGVNGSNVGFCIMCGVHRNNRFVNCTGCSGRGHLACVRKLLDIGNPELNWKCPKCVECSACNGSGEVDPLFKCVTCFQRVHSGCLELPPPLESFTPKTFQCDSCKNRIVKVDDSF